MQRDQVDEFEETSSRRRRWEHFCGEAENVDVMVEERTVVREPRRTETVKLAKIVQSKESGNLEVHDNWN